MPNPSRDKGHRAERAVVAYLRSLGCPPEWRVRRGEPGTAELADRGDVHGVPGVVIQVKDAPSMPMVGARLTAVMVEAEAQRRAAGADLAVVVEKRPGQADPAEWHCWLGADALALLMRTNGAQLWPTWPVRVRLGDVAPSVVLYGLLRR